MQTKDTTADFKSNPFFHLNLKNGDFNIFSITDKCATAMSDKFFYTDSTVEGCIKGKICFSDNFTIFNTTENFEK